MLKPIENVFYAQNLRFKSSESSFFSCYRDPYIRRRRDETILYEGIAVKLIIRNNRRNLLHGITLSLTRITVIAARCGSQ